MLEGSILQQLASAHHATPGKRPLNFGVYYKNTLVALCHALEDCILSSSSPPLVITAFQRGKWYLQEADRYGDIAQKSQQIVIMAAPDGGFAEHPTSQRDNVALVGLSGDDPVAQEWHLMILSPTYTAMVLCQELSVADYGSAGVPEADLERKFYGFWTFEPGLVQETVEIAIAHIGQYDPALHAKLTQQVAEIVAHAGQQEVGDLGGVVSRVVDYLHTSQESLQQAKQTSLPTLSQSKALNNNLVSNELQAFLRMAQLADQTDVMNPMAGAEVAALAEMMGQLLDLPAWQLHRLRLTGLLHRLDPLQATEGLSSTAIIRYPEVAPSCPLTCPLVPAAQVLRTMPRLRAIATILNHQTEWWDGTGYPANLVGDEIPLESRILGLVVEFQQRVTQLQRQLPDNAETEMNQSLSQAFNECQAQQGSRWDPKLVEVLGLLVQGLQQGLSLAIAVPKIAAGLWLLDSHVETPIPAPSSPTTTVS